jgi:GNAT superfamily N-acetyltransferase
MDLQATKRIRTNAGNPLFGELVRLLDAELAERDGPDHGFYHQFNGLAGLDRVVLAEYNGQAVACGGMKEFDQNTLEVKRMYTKAAFRGQGLAGTVLQELERWAAEAGYTRIVLETGKRQPEAVAFYTKHRYQRIENYGPYQGVENSLCFEKMISAGY